MAKFKIGDKVMMRNDLEVNKKYGIITFQSLMVDLKGKVTTVTFVDDRDDTIHVDNGLGFWYDESMFELAPKKPRFKIGDKVRILDGSKIPNYTGGWNGHDMSEHVGEVHTITCVYEWSDGRIAYRMGGIFYKWDERGLELANTQPKIVITTDGKTTTAVFYNGKQRIKDAKVVCAEGDEFNFNYGAALALSRLNGSVAEAKKKSLLNTKICIIEGDNEFKTGHIYEVKDGAFDMYYPARGKFENLDDLKYYFSSVSEENQLKHSPGLSHYGHYLGFIEVLDD